MSTNTAKDKKEETGLSGLDRDLLLRMYRSMKLSRSLEEALIRYAMLGNPVRVGHPYIGQEAVAVGVCTALRPQDYVTSGHRSHGHAIAKGVEPRAFLAELYGRVDGVCGGRSGEMSMADHACGFMGTTEIVAGNAGLAAGLALGVKMRKEDRIVVCFIGDGAMNQGIVHESMNLAAVWTLPVIFVCDNNQYADATPVEYASAVTSLAKRAAAYNIQGVDVDGMDVVAVHQTTREVVEHVLSGAGPGAINAWTYRYFGHYYGDRHQRYRTDAEVEGYKSRDAIDSLRSRLSQAGIASDTEIEAIDSEVEAVTADAQAFAEASHEAGEHELTTGLYNEGGAS